jgi:hypothetical protein
MRKLLIFILIVISIAANGQKYRVTKTVIEQYDTLTQEWKTEIIENNANFSVKVKGRMRSKYLLVNRITDYGYNAVDLHWNDNAIVSFIGNQLIVCKEFEGVKNYIIYYLRQ